jgi:hypothetical protein
MNENDASRIVIDTSRVMIKIVASLTDNSRGIIYYRNMFIVQATESSDFYLYSQMLDEAENVRRGQTL